MGVPCSGKWMTGLGLDQGFLGSVKSETLRRQWVSVDLSRKIHVTGTEFGVTGIWVALSVMELGELALGESLDKEEKRVKNRFQRFPTLKG